MDQIVPNRFLPRRLFTQASCCASHGGKEKGRRERLSWCNLAFGRYRVFLRGSFGFEAAPGGGILRLVRAQVELRSPRIRSRSMDPVQPVIGYNYLPT